MARWTKAAAAALLLILTTVQPTSASQSSPAASFLFSAEQVDSLEQNLTVQILQRKENSVYGPQDSLNFTSHVNRMTTDGAVYIVPQAAGVWVTVEYLTDANEDGVFDLMDAGGSLGYDVLTDAGTLTFSTGEKPALSTGKSYQILAKTLVEREKEYLTQRGGAQADTSVPQTVLNMVLVHYVDVSTGEEESDCYYLRLYDNALPVLSAAHFQDVEPGVWYYPAVDYVAAQGLMAGTNSNYFSPEMKLTRAGLAQVLYALEEKPAVPAPNFVDLASGSWYRDAVSWADEEGLMSGVSQGKFGPELLLTRQQLALILYQYAEMKELDVSARADLSSYSDGSRVQSWARQAAEWAVAEALLSGRGNGTLDPEGAVTRGEFAWVLRSFQQKIA